MLNGAPPPNARPTYRGAVARVLALGALAGGTSAAAVVYRTGFGAEPPSVAVTGGTAARPRADLTRFRNVGNATLATRVRTTARDLHILFRAGATLGGLALFGVLGLVRFSSATARYTWFCLSLPESAGAWMWWARPGLLIAGTFLLIAGAAGLQITRAHDGPINSGVCTACGYNLTGNVSGTCPECGRAVVKP